MAQNKTERLKELRQSILTDNICPELAQSATQLVFGDGNVDADIMFIGEAPGKNEDLQGKPFVGASGKFLNEMLDSIGLRREDIYITNIVKYRPPNNRDPLPDEKAAFLPYLQTQIEVIQPKVVIPLGRHSMNCFLPDLQISQIHGQPKRKKFRFTVPTVGDKRHFNLPSSCTRSTVEMTLVILPLFHPAAALYNGGIRQTLLDDFARIPAVIKKLDQKITKGE